MRLLGFERVTLAPGESKRVTVTADSRLLARFDAASGRWRIVAGEHTVAVGHSAGELPLRSSVQLRGRAFGQ